MFERFNYFDNKLNGKLIDSGTNSRNICSSFSIFLWNGVVFKWNLNTMRDQLCVYFNIQLINAHWKKLTILFEWGIHCAIELWIFIYNKFQWRVALWLIFALSHSLFPSLTLSFVRSLSGMYCPFVYWTEMCFFDIIKCVPLEFLFKFYINTRTIFVLEWWAEL